MLLAQLVQEANRVGGWGIVVFKNEVHACAAGGLHAVQQQLEGLRATLHSNRLQHNNAPA